MTNHEIICETIRGLDTATLTTAEIVSACRDSVPEASIPEIAAALRQVGAEREKEADALNQYDRCQRA